MIVHQPQLRCDGTLARLEVPLEYEQQGALPAQLWFRFPLQYQDIMDTSAHGLVAVLLLTAMHRNESLHIDGEVSTTFLAQLAQVQEYFARWRPDWYARVEVTATSVATPTTQGRAPGVLFPFSGGADSFHCLYTQLPPRVAHATEAVTHALFVHGFDIPLHDTATFETARAAYQELLAELGVTLIPVATNLRRFHARPDWDAAAITAVCGTALLFEKHAGTFYYPEINTYDYLPVQARSRSRTSPFFENPVATLLSSDRMRIENRGGAVSKIEKIASFAHWPPGCGRLRVCWERPNGLRNCGRCEKCVLTMSALEIAGAGLQHTNFDAPLTRRAIRSCRFVPTRLYFPLTWMRYARRHGRRDIAFDYGIVILMSRLAALLRQCDPRPSCYRVSAALKRHVPLYGACVARAKSLRSS